MESGESKFSSLDATSATDDSQTPALEKRKRASKTLQQMAEKCKAELKKLKTIDTTGLAKKRRETHESKIEDLAARVEALLSIRLDVFLLGIPVCDRDQARDVSEVAECVRV
jgi:hypothetical protein